MPARALRCLKREGYLNPELSLKDDSFLEFWTMWTQRHVCLGCIEDPYLQDQLEGALSLYIAACYYCGAQCGGITLEDLSSAMRHSD